MLTSTAQVRAEAPCQVVEVQDIGRAGSTKRRAFEDDRCEMEAPYACGEAIWERPALGGVEAPGAGRDGATIRRSACIR